MGVESPFVGTQMSTQRRPPFCAFYPRHICRRMVRRGRLCHVYDAGVPDPRRKAATHPAVTHVDGSGCLQTVSARTNPLYYLLIDSFRALTKVPMLLNTSFNKNEPVVCGPRQA